MIPIKDYVTAGDSTFTLESEKTGKHFTFKVQQPEEGMPHFVSAMTGPDNEADFKFFGTIFHRKAAQEAQADLLEFRYSDRKAKLAPDAPSVQSFDWFFRHLTQGDLDKFPIKFIPSGKCCRCGRKLTTPESCELGIGPECAKKG